MNMPAGLPRRTALVLAGVQFWFVCSWTVYVVFLPGLLEAAGISKHWVIWILILDQAIFALMDLALGRAADRVRRSYGRIGHWLLAIAAVSCIAFLLLPHLGRFPGGAALSIGCIVVWVATSSVLRAPPWLLLAKYAATPSMPLLAALNLTGLALGGAVAPYLSLLLKGVAPGLPFAVTSIVLFVTTAVLVRVERAGIAADAQGLTPASHDAHEPRRIDAALMMFYAAIGLAGLGFQVHSFVNSAPLYLRFAAQADLPWLLPMFWIGFNVAMFPAASLAKRHGPLAVIASCAFAGCAGLAVATAAQNLEWTIAGQLVAGGAWGGICAASFTAVSRFGHTGREGILFGVLWSTLSIAALLRFAAVAAGFPSSVAMSMAVMPAVLFGVAGGLLLLTYRSLGRAAQHPSGNADAGTG